MSIGVGAMTKIYLGCVSEKHVELCGLADHKRVLFSFHDFYVKKKLSEKIIGKYHDEGFDIMLDSGAVALRHAGITDYPLTYLDAYIDFLKRNDDYLSCYVIPDVVGDREKTSRYADYLVKGGVNQEKLIYVVHSPVVGGRMQDAFDALKRGFTYIGFGGWFGVGTDTKVRYLQEVYHDVVKAGCRVHFFGITSIKPLLQFIPYSADSTTWYISAAYLYQIQLSDGSRYQIAKDVDEKVNYSQPKSLSFEVLRQIVDAGLEDHVDDSYLPQILNARFFRFIERVIANENLRSKYLKLMQAQPFSEVFYRNLADYLYSLEQNPEVFDTPRRWINALTEYCFGYIYNAYEVIGKDFRPPANDELIKVTVPFSSLCMHHLLPFYGKVYIEYRPRDKILGLSKFSRVVYVLSRRLQLQEKLTKEIYDVLYNTLKPKYLRVRIRAKHLCNKERGIRVGSVFETEVSSDGNSND